MALHRTRRTWAVAPALAVSLVVTATLVWPTGAARAHGGDGAQVHACVVPASGAIRIVDASEDCRKNEAALDWARTGAVASTYSAGFGLALDPNNQFSVTGAPWGGLTNVPAGFADNDDDDGAAQVAELLRDISEGRVLLDGSAIKAGTITASGLAGRYEFDFGQNRYVETVAGAVTGEKIKDGTIEERDLSQAMRNLLTSLETRIAELEARVAALEAAE